MRTKLLEAISRYVDLDQETLIRRGVEALLQEKRRAILIERLQPLARYGVDSAVELERKIRDGEVEEHPAWEDLITLENLDATLEKVDDYLRDLSRTTADRPQGVPRHRSRC